MARGWHSARNPPAIDDGASPADNSEDSTSALKANRMVSTSSAALRSASRRVLVIEDEMMIAMLLEDMLADLGHQVVGVAGRLDVALELARDADADLAILDVDLGGESSFPVAEVLTSRGLPFLFATGFG